MDMESLMAQASELQNKVAAAQELLAKTIVKGIADNGACIVDMTGKYDMVKITINPDVLIGNQLVQMFPFTAEKQPTYKFVYKKFLFCKHINFSFCICNYYSRI